MTERVRLSPSGRELDTAAEIEELQAQITVLQNEMVEALRARLTVVDEPLAARTLTAADANTYIRCTNAAGCVLTANAGVFARGDWIMIRQVAAGAVSFAGTAVITPPVTKAATTAQQGATIALTFSSANDADASGDLSDV